VRFVHVLTVALLIGIAATAAAQAPPASTLSGTFIGTAEAKNANGAMSGKVEITLRRVTPDFDRKSVETALKEGGYPRFLTALRNAPQVGQLVLAGGAPIAIRYAVERQDSGGHALIVVTEKPAYFIGGNRAESAPRKGYEVAVVEIRLDGKGANTGSMAAAARVRPNADGGVWLDDYAETLITISGVTRKP
jgi:hypothetical protein